MSVTHSVRLFDAVAGLLEERFQLVDPLNKPGRVPVRVRGGQRLAKRRRLDLSQRSMNVPGRPATGLFALTLLAGVVRRHRSAREDDRRTPLAAEALAPAGLGGRPAPNLPPRTIDEQEVRLRILAAANHCMNTVQFFNLVRVANGMLAVDIDPDSVRSLALEQLEHTRGAVLVEVLHQVEVSA